MKDALSPTELPGRWDHLEAMSPKEIAEAMSFCDKEAVLAVSRLTQEIGHVIALSLDRVAQGGRVFYIGAGTSGRLGILDASEIPPTFGVSGRFIGLIAGGDQAIRKAVEGAEDDPEGGIRDLQDHKVNGSDVVIGIAASGRTPYVIGALKWGRSIGALTVAVTSNPEGPITTAAELALVAETGPEFITGSTRLKAGTAQKLILNQISTGIMIGSGHVQGNRMVDMQLANAKLVERGARMVAETLDLPMDQALQLLTESGSVRSAIDTFSARE